MRAEFSNKVKAKAAERAAGKCQKCGLPFNGRRPHFDHILPDALGGEATLANCSVLCEPCHAEKTSKEDVPRIRKADRQKRSALGIKRDGQKIASRGFPTSEKKREPKQALPPKPMFEDCQ